MDTTPALTKKLEEFQNLVVACATGQDADSALYSSLRLELLGEASLRDLLPEFIHTRRTLDQYWQFIKLKYATYKERREYLWGEFRPAFEWLEQRNAVPTKVTVAINADSAAKPPTHERELAGQIEYDVALSFAGEDRDYVHQVAEELIRRGIRVFYDSFVQVDLWGKDLYSHLAEVYGKRSRHTVLFISKHYANKLWTNHERRSAQARAFTEHSEYILPARFDDTEVAGIPGTIGYIDLRNLNPQQFASMIKDKVAATKHGVSFADGLLKMPNTGFKERARHLAEQARRKQIVADWQESAEAIHEARQAVRTLFGFIVSEVNGAAAGGVPVSCWVRDGTLCVVHSERASFSMGWSEPSNGSSLFVREFSGSYNPDAYVAGVSGVKVVSSQAIAFEADQYLTRILHE